METENNPFIGTIKVTSKGVGYFTVEGQDEDFEIAPEHMNTALNRDTVRIKDLNKINTYGRKMAMVEEVLERNKMQFVGDLEKTPQGFFLIPDDKRMYRDIFLGEIEAKDGDKAFVRIVEWNDGQKSPRGELIKIIGRAGEHNTEMEAIVYGSGFEVGFPPQVDKEAEEWKERWEKEDHLANGRRDFRDRTTFTIDPADAKDFDDALSIKKLDGDKYEIGIHIADVSHFVVEGTELDREAKKRGTSIYLVDRTIPMLPEVLSNDLCSLNPNEDKYAFSSVFTMNTEGEVLERWFGKTLINSDKRFTYEEAQDTLDKKSGPFYEELEVMNNIAYKLRAEKFKAGAIDFETEEVKFVLDDKGRPIKVYKKERKDTHKLVEDFMLLANREVATHMYASDKTGRAAFVYRIHDAPDREKIINLATFVKALGFELKNKDGDTTAEDISKMLKSVTGSPAEALVKTAAVRAMSKAVYSTSNIGHFGLAFEYYTNFTSPIRRYPDLMVHRLLQRYIEKGKIEPDEIAKYQRLCDASSEREMEAAEAERSSIKYKQVEYMESRIGEEFDATISGVSEWGIFVEETNTKAEGMVRLRDLGDDFYELNEKMYAIVGKKSGKKYSLGDKVRVRLTGADTDKKTLDFTLI